MSYGYKYEHTAGFRWFFFLFRGQKRNWFSKAYKDSSEAHFDYGTQDNTLCYINLQFERALNRPRTNKQVFIVAISPGAANELQPRKQNNGPLTMPCAMGNTAGVSSTLSIVFKFWGFGLVCQPVLLLSCLPASWVEINLYEKVFSGIDTDLNGGGRARGRLCKQITIHVRWTGSRNTHSMQVIRTIFDLYLSFLVQ